MFGRVGLLALGILIAVVLNSYFGVPTKMALIVGIIPFAIGEAKGRGPYEKTAHEIMHEQDASPPKGTDKNPVV